MVDHVATPGRLEPKLDPSTRPTRSLAVPMILIVTGQELRACICDPQVEDCILRDMADKGISACNSTSIGCSRTHRPIYAA